jgi:hypothetical protein
MFVRIPGGLRKPSLSWSTISRSLIESAVHDNPRERRDARRLAEKLHLTSRGSYVNWQDCGSMKGREENADASSWVGPGRVPSLDGISQNALRRHPPEW